MSIPSTIEQLATPRPVAQGEVTPQEIRVGQMLLAQSIIALTKRVEAVLGRLEAGDGKFTGDGIALLEDAIAKAKRPAKAPKPRAPKPAPEPTPPPAPAPVEPPAPAANPAPAALTIAVPPEISRTAKEAYFDGYAAGLAGDERANPHQGTRGIPAGRRIAWDRGFDDGRAA